MTWWRDSPQRERAKRSAVNLKLRSSTLGCVPGLLSPLPASGGGERPHSKGKELETLLGWGPPSSAVGRKRDCSQLCCSGVLPLHILEWSRHNCVTSFNFDGKVCQCFCFLIFSALFVNPCRKPLFLSHSNSFRRSCLICCLI